MANHTMFMRRPRTKLKCVRCDRRAAVYKVICREHWKLLPQQFKNMLTENSGTNGWAQAVKAVLAYIDTQRSIDSVTKDHR